MKIVMTLVMVVFCSVISFADERVSLPEDYRDSFVEYLSLDRVQNPDQFIRLFANETAMEGRDKNGELPDGSILVAEVYSVKKTAEGKVKTSTLGRRIHDKLLLLAVMEKQDAFGKNPISAIKTGSWDFAAYKPNGEVAPKNIIEAGQALTMDYATTEDTLFKPFPCLCGTPNCRFWITGRKEEVSEEGQAHIDAQLKSHGRDSYEIVTAAG